LTDELSRELEVILAEQRTSGLSVVGADHNRGWQA